MSVKCERGRQDNEIHHEVGKKSADANVELAIDNFFPGCAFPLHEQAAPHCFFFFNFLRCLPEK
jgi:hypothetical protein